jgi:hypothetical protein
MTTLTVRGRAVRTVAALHLPAMPSAAQPGARSLSEVEDYALRNARIAFENGIEALYIQDLGDSPVAPSATPHTIARITAVGSALRRSFPDAPLGVCLMAHGAEAPLAVAQAMDADFVRLKVYLGAMVKAEGVLQGCAWEAIQYRAAIRAEEVRILADVYDRTGIPLAPLPIREAVRQATTYGHADGVVLTGADLGETLRMVSEVRGAEQGVPLIAGGGVTVETVARALGTADAVIVSTALKRVASWSPAGLESDWDPQQVRAFVLAAAL